MNQQQHSQRYHQRMQALGATPNLTRLDPSGTTRLALADFSSFEGEYEASPYLMLNMCTKNISRLRRVGDGQHLEGVLRPGTVGLALPHTKAEGYWGEMQLLGIGVDLQALNNNDERASFQVEDLIASASTFHNDPLLTAVMTAMWRDAEEHGLSSAFFEHGLELVLNRLANYKVKPSTKRVSRRLLGTRLTRVLDLMESRISSNVTLLELAQLVDQDKSSFSRSFRDAMGYAPYEYFTLRRMERAKQLLHTSQSITEIAFSVGYTNPSKFSSAFKRLYAMTPSAWRHALD